MPGLARDINRLARGTPEFVIIEGYPGFSLHHRPMLFTPKMFLITKFFPWPHSEPLDFIRRGIQEHLPMSPGRSRMVGTRCPRYQALRTLRPWWARRKNAPAR